MEITFLRGLKRSGNHAVLHYIEANSPTPLLVLNNAIPIRNFLDLTSAIPKDLNVKRLIARARVINLSRGPSGIARSVSKKVYITLEDWSPDFMPFLSSPALNQKNIYVVREFRNLFASRIEKALRNPHNPRLKAYSLHDEHISDRAIRLWKEYARTFLETHLSSRHESRTSILFDAFVRSPSYRARISKALNLSSSGIELPPLEEKIGGGSSFGNNFWTPFGVLEREHQLSPRAKRILEKFYMEYEVHELNTEITKIISDFT